MNKPIFLLFLCSLILPLLGRGESSDVNTPEENPLGEWYAVGFSLASETADIYRLFEYNESQRSAVLPDLLNQLGVNITDLKTDEYQMLKDGWSDKISGRNARFTFSSDQSSSKMPQALRGFHSFRIAAGKSGSLTPDDVANIQKSVVVVKTTSGHGTGFFISPDHILTNHHVIKDHINVVIRNDFSDVLVKGEVVGYSKIHDLAIIRVDKSDSLNRSILQIGSPSESMVGEEIAIFGYPISDDLGITTTFGKISATRIHKQHGRVFQLSGAEANPGNSGGPLVDAKGTAIGILTFGFDHITDMKGFTFCVSISEAHQLIEKFCPNALSN